jgi:RimJ/RimL family protein N-acetyltransferase
VIETFSTSRLTAERLHERHLPDLIALHLDVEVSRYLGGVRSAETTTEYLKTNMAHWDRHGFGLFALHTQDGAFAGRAGIRHLAVDDGVEIEVAYTFKRSCWGRGLASEIAGALTEVGLLELKLPLLVGLIHAGNVASRRVLEKLNYVLARSTIYHGEDVVIYHSPRASALRATGSERPRYRIA